MRNLVLIRHGESQWNKENRFTGWSDVDLTEKGYNGGQRGRQIIIYLSNRIGLLHNEK